MQLEQIQQKFAQRLLIGAPDAELNSIVSPQAADERWALYRGNLLAHWSNALRNAYPVMEQVVGVEYFTQLSREYGQKFPTADANLNLFGKDFPCFLAQHTVAQDYPYFSELAALEWALHLAYYAQDVPALTLTDLAQQAQRGWECVYLSAAAANCLLSSDFAIADIWLAHQRPAAEQMPMKLVAPCKVLVYRKSWRPMLMKLDRADFFGLQALFAGQSLAAALDLSLAADPDLDVAAKLRLWLDSEIFVSTNLP